MLRPGLVEHCYADGEALVRQGDHGTHLLYLVEGTVDVLLRLAPAREQAPPDAGTGCSPSPLPKSASRLAPAREQAPRDASTHGSPQPSSATDARSPGCAASSGARGDGCTAGSGRCGGGSRGEDGGNGGEDGAAGGSSGGSGPPTVPEIVGDELPPALLEVGADSVLKCPCVRHMRGQHCGP